jgi:hypothetical protein
VESHPPVLCRNKIARGKQSTTTNRRRTNELAPGEATPRRSISRMMGSSNHAPFMGADPDSPPPPLTFNRDQRHFLEFHRREVFLGAGS